MSGPRFRIDLGRCVGCAACVLACRLEQQSEDASLPFAEGRTLEARHRADQSPARRRVLSLNLRRHPDVPTYFLSVACHHCEEPACVAACPVGAYRVRDDGIVSHDVERCIGCRYCEMACPFGAPRFDTARGVASKCDLCAERLDAGGQPACVAACPTGALMVVSEPEYGDRSIVPGLADVAQCRPRTLFVAPKGRREELVHELEKRL